MATLPPFLAPILNAALNSPGFKETIANLNAFISSCEARLAYIEENQRTILKLLEVRENGRENT